MEQNTFIGLINCSDTMQDSQLQQLVKKTPQQIKTVWASRKWSSINTQAFCPDAEIAEEVDHIINDQSINLVVICAPKKEDRPLISACLKANKKVQVLFG